jgi:tetratricopeptide (TPR) repeat protein
MIVGLVLQAALAGAAFADEPDREAAAKKYQSGMAHYRLEEYDAAIVDFEGGFRIHPAPEFLYNIAQAHRLAKRPDKAVAFYQKYLYMSPDASNRAEVEHLIAALKEQAAHPQTAATPGPSSSEKPTGAKSAAPTTSRADLTAKAPDKKSDRPLTKKGWFWGVMGGVAAVVVAGAVTGIVLGTRDNTRTVPGVQF